MRAPAQAPAARVAATARRVRTQEGRVEQQPGFVLHSYPWRETSLVLDVFTRDHGRMALVARGAKRPGSHFRGILNPFSPLSLGWTGRGEIRTLTRVEWVGGLAPLRGSGLLDAFYLNELVVRLLARGDAHEALFLSYARALRALSLDGESAAQALHGFELDVLRETGVAPSFDVAFDGSAVDEGGWYRVDPEHGVVPAGASAPDGVGGGVLLAMARRELPAMAADPAAGAVLRQLIGYHLRGKPLNTRRILADLRRI
jgi:DNA repair protein RecO (recombination protein O)